MSPEASILWSGISKENQKLLLGNVYCSNCGTAVQIKEDFTASVDHGDLILNGICSMCNGPVARVIETAELDAARN